LTPAQRPGSARQPSLPSPRRVCGRRGRGAVAHWRTGLPFDGRWQARETSWQDPTGIERRKCQVLPLARDNPMQQDGLGAGGSFAARDLGCWWAASSSFLPV